jgi:hypothetical protein
VSAPKAGAPVVGFNHNVQYGPRLYHVQTEDSGLPHAHYITHLFVGGNIVASMKSSYVDLVDAEPDLPKAVRFLMEAQHKAMLKRLVSGEFSEAAERVSAHYEPGVLATGQTGPAAVNAKGAPPAPRGPPAPLFPKAPLPKQMTQAAPARPPAPRQQPVWQPAPPGASPAAPPRLPGGPLPATTRVPPKIRPAAPPPTMTPTTTPALRPAARAVPKSAPPARPQNIFADDTKPVEAPHEDLPTLFAEELISEKSLDEVILAFLSADLEPPK